MSKAKWALALSAVALLLLLFSLPRVVVENNTLALEEAAPHAFELEPDVRNQLTVWRQQWASAADTEKKLNFADSLASLYLDHQMLDSAVWFTDYIRDMDKTGRELRIADLYYWAFQRTADATKAKETGEKAAAEIRQLLEKYPDNSSLKNRLAMTLVATENPMQGIQMLLGVLEENPGDAETLKNLGILSIQSGQFDKAEARFRELLQSDSTDLEAIFYLGMSLMEQNKPEGRKIMEGLSGIEANPAIQSLAIEYLEN